MPPTVISPTVFPFSVTSPAASIACRYRRHSHHEAAAQPSDQHAGQDTCGSEQRHVPNQHVGGASTYFTRGHGCLPPVVFWPERSLGPHGVRGCFGGRVSAASSGDGEGNGGKREQRGQDRPERHGAKRQGPDGEQGASRPGRAVHQPDAGKHGRAAGERGQAPPDARGVFAEVDPNAEHEEPRGEHARKNDECVPSDRLHQSRTSVGSGVGSATRCRRGRLEGSGAGSLHRWSSASVPPPDAWCWCSQRSEAISAARRAPGFRLRPAGVGAYPGKREPRSWARHRAPCGKSSAARVLSCC